MLRDRDKEIIKFLEKNRGITIEQAARLFFTSYSYAQRRLKELQDEQLITSHYNKVFGKVYTLVDKISTHDLYCIELYSLLIKNECKIKDYKIQYSCYRNQLRPDMFISFVYDNSLYYYFLEVEDTHYTTMTKFQTYEMFFKSNEMQKQCNGVFPGIIILGFNPIQYQSQNFETIYLQFNDLKRDETLEQLL